MQVLTPRAIQKNGPLASAGMGWSPGQRKHKGQALRCEQAAILCAPFLGELQGTTSMAMSLQGG